MSTSRQRHDARNELDRLVAHGYIHSWGTVGPTGDRYMIHALPGTPGFGPLTAKEVIAYGRGARIGYARAQRQEQEEADA